MKAIREEQVAQALSYLRAMNSAKLFIDAVCQSPEFLRRLWAEILESPTISNIMKKLEEDGSLPYYVTHEYFPWGECYSILTVSPYEEDFAIGAPQCIGKDLYRVYAYVWNVTDDTKSESGTVILKNEYGLLRRVG